jgi:hypothetical protein
MQAIEDAGVVCVHIGEEYPSQICSTSGQSDGDELDFRHAAFAVSYQPQSYRPASSVTLPIIYLDGIYTKTTLSTSKVI